jgi:hypothetical protein
MRLSALNLVIGLVVVLVWTARAGNSPASEESGRPLSETSLRDTRAEEEVGLRTPVTFTPFASRNEWKKRAAIVRDHILVSTGLWPMPKKTPLNPKVFGRIEREGYSVEKVHFESYPHFFVTGNLYRPLGKKGPFPGVLCPHGHWGRGRLHSDDTGSIPGRCINLACQGYVVFSYDMVGYNDSNQLKHSFHDEPWGISLM